MQDNSYNDYINFIKQYVVYRCFLELKKHADQEKEVYDLSLDQMMQTYIDNPLKEIWDTIFNKMYDHLKYMANALYQSYDYKSSQSINMYKYETFQEYVDNMIGVNTINMFYYNIFIKNMKNEDFVANLREKYKVDQTTANIKNGIVDITNRLIKTFVLHETDNNDKQIHEYLSLNIIPFIEYKNSVIYKNMLNKSDIEDRVIQEIQDFLFNEW